MTQLAPPALQLLLSRREAVGSLLQGAFGGGQLALLGPDPPAVRGQRLLFVGQCLGGGPEPLLCVLQFLAVLGDPGEPVIVRGRRGERADRHSSFGGHLPEVQRLVYREVRNHKPRNSHSSRVVEEPFCSPGKDVVVVDQ